MELAVCLGVTLHVQAHGAVQGIIKHSFTSSHILETDAGEQVTRD